MKSVAQNTSEEKAMQRKDSTRVHEGPLETLAHKAPLHAMMRFHKARQSTISEKRTIEGCKLNNS